MSRKKIFVAVTVLILTVISATPSKLEAENRLKMEVGLGPYTETDDPFNPFPLLKLGFHTKLFGSFTLGAALGYTRWRDYLGMYGGVYNFQCYRPEIELAFFFPDIFRGFLETFAGVGLGYNFYHIKNELDNPYPGGLEDHVFLSPFLGADINLISGGSVSSRIIYFTTRLVWNIIGDFRGIRGSLGLGIRIN